MKCAWELYTKLCTIAAVTAKLGDTECKNFSGGLFIESLNSVYGFFQKANQMMRKSPVGRIGTGHETHLAVIISRVLADVLRPFLEKGLNIII